jgi:hypothetical protein
MQFPIWLSDPDMSRVALVAGGDEGSVVSLMCGPDRAPANIVCDQPTARRLSECELTERTGKTAIIVSRGLAKDCELLISAHRPRPTLMHDSVVQYHLASERDRSRAKLFVLSGYETPLQLIERFASNRVVRFARDISRRFVAPLVIHDRQSKMTGRALGSIAVFAYPDAPDGDTSARDNGEHMSPALDDIDAHARFLAGTDVDVLVDIHRGVANDDGGEVLAFWDTNLVRLARERSGRDSLVDDARAQLAAIRGRLAPCAA